VSGILEIFTYHQERLGTGVEHGHQPAQAAGLAVKCCHRDSACDDSIDVRYQALVGNIDGDGLVALVD
jgi:hypothetical protein